MGNRAAAAVLSNEDVRWLCRSPCLFHRAVRCSSLTFTPAPQNRPCNFTSSNVTVQGCSYCKRRSEDIKASKGGSSFIVLSDSQDLTRSWGFLLYEIGHTLGKILERICKPRVLVSWTKFEKQRCGLRSAMNSLDERPFNIGKFLGPRDNPSSQRSALNVWMNVQSESDIVSTYWHLAWVCVFAVFL